MIYFIKCEEGKRGNEVLQMGTLKRKKPNVTVDPETYRFISDPDNIEKHGSQGRVIDFLYEYYRREVVE